jgi:hypothetical protein
MEIFSPSLTGHSHDGHEMTKDEYDRYDAVLAFLKGALATGPTSVAELEVQARAAMFLGERQSITHSKPFKRAKRTLGIRSVRAGFGVAGEWFWTLPPPLRSEKHGPARTTSSEASPAIIDGAGQIACGPIGVPLEWIYGGPGPADDAGQHARVSACGT